MSNAKFRAQFLVLYTLYIPIRTYLIYICMWEALFKIYVSMNLALIGIASLFLFGIALIAFGKRTLHIKIYAR